MLLKDVPLRTRRVPSLYKAYGHSTLLVLNGTSFNSINVLLALSRSVQIPVQWTVIKISTDITILFLYVSGQLATRTIPHRTGIGPDEWFYSVVVWGVVLVGNSPRDCGPGGQWLGFIIIWWGIVLGGELS